MKTMWVLSPAAATLVAFAASAQTIDRYDPRKHANTDAVDLAAIVALEHRDDEASKINDVDVLVSLWTEDGVLLQPRSQAAVGIGAIRQVLEQQKQQSASISTLAYDEDWKERCILGDEAYEWGEISVTIRLPNGKEVTQAAHSIRILRRQKDGSWKFARAIAAPAGVHQN